MGESESLGLEGLWFFLCLHHWEEATRAREQGPTWGWGRGPGSLLTTQDSPPAPYARYNSAKKDNDFIYHEAVPALDTLQPVKGLKLRGAWDGVGDEGAAEQRQSRLGGPGLHDSLPLPPRCPLGEALASEPHRPCCYGP